jgi:hypothetical protein
MPNKYNSMNDVPIGTKMIIKETKEEVELLEIQNYPTNFIVKFNDGRRDSFLTHQVEILNWPDEL